MVPTATGLKIPMRRALPAMEGNASHDNVWLREYLLGRREEGRS